MRPDLHLTQPQPQPQPSSPLTILHGGVAAISKQQQQQRKLQLNIELRKCVGDVEGEGGGEEGGDERLMKLAPPTEWENLRYLAYFYTLIIDPFKVLL